MAKTKNPRSGYIIKTCYFCKQKHRGCDPCTGRESNARNAQAEAKRSRNAKTDCICTIL